VRVRRIELASAASEQAGALAKTIRAFTPRPTDLSDSVSEILAAVRERGDAAVGELSRKFDTERAPLEARISRGRLEASLAGLDPQVREALEVAIANVRAVAEADRRDNVSVTLAQGQRVDLRAVPLRRAGVYVPGGRAPYPSTVVMCSVPAKVAGVEQLVVVTPPGKEGDPNDLILAACALCGVTEVLAVGGAQAIAALAYGTESVEPVDVIVGPGSAYVQEAKRQVVGTVGIDGIEGPSELVVIADEGADPGLVALDLAAQAEHGPGTLLAVLSTSDELLRQVEKAARALEPEHDPLRDTPLAFVLVPSLAAGLELANALAPEHLELSCSGAEQLADGVRASGCVFLGRNGGAAFGDYAAGSNHVLPTGGAARYASPLGVSTFLRRQAVVSLPDEAAQALAPYVSSLARAEGFPVHAESAEARTANRDTS
jgi:histidinol dehydrogenase